jgi:hypothetical protein
VIVANPEPVEIRNQIFDLMLEPEEATLSPLKQNFPEGVHDPEEKRLFFAVTQVCRQLRSEFLPIYLAQNVVHVLHDHLLAYLDVFARPITNDASSTTGNIALDLLYGPDGHATADTFDLFPALMLCAKSPRLTIQLGAYHCHYYNAHVLITNEALLDGLLKIHSNDRLVAYVQEAVAGIKVFYRLDMVFKIKSGHWQAWMQESDGSWLKFHPSKSLNVEFRGWQVGLGLPTSAFMGLISFVKEEVGGVSDERDGSECE